MITGHARLNFKINACMNSNTWTIDIPAYCISDQNNLHKCLHYRQRNFSFQHNLHLKTQAFHFHIIHFLKCIARRSGHGSG